MGLAAFLNGMTNGYRTGTEWGNAQLEAKNAAYLAPYKNYDAAMTALYHGKEAPLRFNELRTQMDNAMLDLRNKQYAERAYQQNIRGMARDSAAQYAARYADPEQPLQYDDATQQMLAYYNMTPPTNNYGIASSIAHQMYGNSMQAMNAYQNANKYPAPLVNTTTVTNNSGDPQAAAPVWSAHAVPYGGTAPPPSVPYSQSPPGANSSPAARSSVLSAYMGQSPNPQQPSANSSPVNQIPKMSVNIAPGQPWMAIPPAPTPSDPTTVIHPSNAGLLSGVPRFTGKQPKGTKQTVKNTTKSSTQKPQRSFRNAIFDAQRAGS